MEIASSPLYSSTAGCYIRQVQPRRGLACSMTRYDLVILSTRRQDDSIGMEADLKMTVSIWKMTVSIWKMTVSMWKMRVSTWDISSLCLQLGEVSQLRRQTRQLVPGEFQHLQRGEFTEL